MEKVCMPQTIKLKEYTINPALLVIDVQNGFVSKGGSYDLLGMETLHYRKIIPNISDLINLCRNAGIPIFYTQAVRETWDAAIVDEIKPAEDDHVVIKRRDSAFLNTEIGVWLRSLSIDTLIFCGIDTSICVETSLRDAFNIGYDVVLISDATASSNKKHYESTLENVKGYYGIVMDMKELSQYMPQSQLSPINNRTII